MMAGTPPPPFTHVGKQVLAHGVHYADAADLKAAEFMVTALNEHAVGWMAIEDLPQEGIVLGYFPNERDSRRISVMTIREGEPWTVGSIFAFDLTPPTFWRPLPSAPEVTK